MISGLLFLPAAGAIRGAAHVRVLELTNASRTGAANGLYNCCWAELSQLEPVWKWQERSYGASVRLVCLAQ